MWRSGQGPQIVEGLVEMRLHARRGVVDPGLAGVVVGGPAGPSGQVGQPVGDTSLTLEQASVRAEEIWLSRHGQS